MFGIIIRPPYGETANYGDSLLINEAARSIYLSEFGHKYFLFSKVKKYEMDNSENSCGVGKRLNIRLN